MVNSKPKISAIIPNYNHAAYLKQRIDSVLNQTYRDFEVIILDDCSTDNSKDIIEQYRTHEKVSLIIYNEVNSGNPFKQWDKGIGLAKGEYIWLAESDDWCEITLLETIMAGIENKENCVLGYCQGYCVMENNAIKFQSSHTSLAEYVDGKNFIKDFILPRNPIFNAGMAVWKKKIYESVSREYLNFKLIGDYFFWIEVAKCGSVFISGKLLNYFRTHEANVSINSFNSGVTYFERLPLLKHLLQTSVIDKKGYNKSLRQQYFYFRFAEKGMQKENSIKIEKTFSDYSDYWFELKFYFLLKRIQFSLKKLLRV